MIAEMISVGVTNYLVICRVGTAICNNVSPVAEFNIDAVSERNHRKSVAGPVERYNGVLLSARV